MSRRRIGGVEGVGVTRCSLGRGCARMVWLPQILELADSAAVPDVSGRR